MPFLNAGAYIEEAIGSVLGQTYHDWELLLIDDGSTDGGTSIARAYADRHPDRIRYFAHVDHASRGASASRNVGLCEARGEYLALLDADDVWLPNKLADQVPMLDANPEVGMLYGNTLYWYSWSEQRRENDFLPRLGLPSGTVLHPPELLIRCLQGAAAVPCTCSILLRRKAVDRIGGFEEEFRRVFTDQVFYAKLFLTTPVLAVDVWWDKYRIHDDSSCAVTEREGRMHEAQGVYLAWLASYLEEAGKGRGPAWRAVQRERWLHRHPRIADLRRQMRENWREMWDRLQGAWQRRWPMHAPSEPR